LGYYKDFISASLATVSEALEEKLRFRHTLLRARNEIAHAEEPFLWEPFQQCMSVPGRRLKSLSDSRQTMEPYARQVRAMIKTLVPRYEPYRRMD